ncbi:ferredoxin [Chloracidobacterium validum]|uniref:Ferredoxin n=1 Tax=Chloracidobacterium validum TaxID=2821543 RepID=A0ABX8BEP3_9BACT|nr:ferredoxin [Chloracidobacterium validum]
MAQVQERFPENTHGPFDVDARRIDCDGCRSIVPEVFAHHDRRAPAYALRQPEPEDENRQTNATKRPWRLARLKPSATMASQKAPRLCKLT